MSQKDVVRYWKDPLYREKLSMDQKSNMPSNPIGDISQEIDEEEMKTIAAAGVDINTTGGTTNCTHLQGCCPPGSGISKYIGGFICTITKGCMRICG